jgi:pilus assembly protein TadC
MTIAALLLAAALLCGAQGPSARRRLDIPDGDRRLIRGRRQKSDPFALASTLDVLAVCLSAGMAVSAAAAASARCAPPTLRDLLWRAAELLALGADPDIAWRTQGGDRDDGCSALARLARRSASSGSAMAEGIAELAEQSRADADHTAAAATERAGVLIAGPLGLCFLPAFVCLGIAPAVAGLAGDIFGSGLL